MRDLWGALRSLLSLLPKDARGFLLRYSISSSALALLDIAALGLLAVILASLAGGRAVTLPVVGELSTSGVIGVLVAACLLMVIKSMIALAQQWYVTRRIAQFELVIVNRLFEAYIRAPGSSG